MKIFIHAPHYNPTKKPISRLLNDLVESLSSRGHEIIVFTAKNGQEAEPFCNEKIVRINNLGGLSESTFLKLLDYLSFYLQSTLASIFFGSTRKGTVTIFRSSFGISSIAAYVLSKISKSNIVFWVLDRYPDILFENKLFRRTYLFNFLKAIEIGIQKRIPNIIFETRSDQEDYLQYKGLENSTLVRTWHEGCSLASQKPEFWDDLGFSTQKIFVFSGNIGNSIDLLSMVTFFREQRDYTLLVLGTGSNKGELKSLIASNKLQNIFLADYLDYAQYMYVLKHALYGVVSLKPDITTFSSKLTSYIASDLPILAFLSDENEMASIVREFNCGLVINASSKNEAMILNEETAKKHKANLVNAKKLFDPSDNIAKLTRVVESGD